MVSVCSKVLAKLSTPAFEDGIEDRRSFVSRHGVSIGITGEVSGLPREA